MATVVSEDITVSAGDFRIKPWAAQNDRLADADTPIRVFCAAPPRCCLLSVLSVMLPELTRADSLLLTEQARKIGRIVKPKLVSYLRDVEVGMCQQSF